MDPKVEGFLQQNGLKQPRFEANSRYVDAEILQWDNTTGEPIQYLAPRIIPDPRSFEPMQQHHTVTGDRLDNLASHYLNDPHLQWQLCDANTAFNPAKLCAKEGRTLIIAQPLGATVPRVTL